MNNRKTKKKTEISPLQQSIVSGDYETFTKLLSETDVSTFRAPDGGTLLHFIIKSITPQHAKAQCQMLAAAAKIIDVNKVDSDGDTPLHYAISVASPIAVLILLTAGAKVNLANKDGDTVLHQLATSTKELDLKILEIILTRCPESELGFSILGSQGLNFWHLIITYQNNSLMKKLADLKMLHLMPVDEQIHLAANTKRYSILQCMLDMGLQPSFSIAYSLFESAIKNNDFNFFHSCIKWFGMNANYHYGLMSFCLRPQNHKVLNIMFLRTLEKMFIPEYYQTLPQYYSDLFYLCIDSNETATLKHLIDNGVMLRGNDIHVSPYYFAIHKNQMEFEKILFPLEFSYIDDVSKNTAMHRALQVRLPLGTQLFILEKIVQHNNNNRSLMPQPEEKVANTGPASTSPQYPIFTFNEFNSSGSTPLYIAMSDDLELVAFLVEKAKVDVTVQVDNRNPIDFPLSDEKFATAYYLLEKGASPISPFMHKLVDYALQTERIDILNTLYRLKVLPNILCRGFPPLHLAIMLQKKNLITCLLAQIIMQEPKVKNTLLGNIYQGYTSVGISAYYDDLDTFIELIDAGAPFPLASKLNAFQIALMNHSKRMLEHFIENYGDLIKHKFDDGVTILMLIAKQRNFDLLHLIIERKCCLEAFNEVTPDGRTLLEQLGSDSESAFIVEQYKKVKKKIKEKEENVEIVEKELPRHYRYLTLFERKNEYLVSRSIFHTWNNLYAQLAKTYEKNTLVTIPFGEWGINEDKKIHEKMPVVNEVFTKLNVSNNYTSYENQGLFIVGSFVLHVMYLEQLPYKASDIDMVLSGVSMDGVVDQIADKTKYQYNLISNQEGKEPHQVITLFFDNEIESLPSIDIMCVPTSKLEQSMWERDFTISGIMLNLTRCEIIAPLDWIKDLIQRIIRVISEETNLNERFKKEFLLKIRAVYLFAKLKAYGFTMDDETLAAIRNEATAFTSDRYDQCTHLIVRLTKVFTTHGIEPSYQFLHDFNLLNQIKVKPQFVERFIKEKFINQKIKGPAQANLYQIHLATLVLNLLDHLHDPQKFLEDNLSSLQLLMKSLHEMQDAKVYHKLVSTFFVLLMVSGVALQPIFASLMDNELENNNVTQPKNH